MRRRMMRPLAPAMPGPGLAPLRREVPSPVGSVLGAMMTTRLLAVMVAVKGTVCGGVMGVLHLVG